MDESGDRIRELISQIPAAATKKERMAIAKQLLDHFTFFQGEVNNAMSEQFSADDEWYL
jgi:hypothetical protein